MTMQDPAFTLFDLVALLLGAAGVVAAFALAVTAALATGAPQP